MISFKHNDTKYEVPSSWSELTFKQWKDLQNTEEEAEVISILTGLPLSLAKRLDGKSKYNLNGVLSFINTKLNIDNFSAPENIVLRIGHKNIEIPVIKNIREESFRQKIHLQNILPKDMDDFYKKMVEIILVYAQPIIEDKKFSDKNFDELSMYFENIFLVDLYSTAMLYINQMHKILELESKALKFEPTVEQKMAGIEKFNVLGAINTVDALAQRYRMSWDEVMDEDYETTFVRLVKSKKDRGYESAYREIMRKKNK